MIPRGRLDIGWFDLSYGFFRCLRSGDLEAAQRRIEALWGHEGDGLACLSVRSGFDLLLTVLDYPPGTEILVSALNIRDMLRVVCEHGLIPVPVDVDMETLSPRPASLEAGVSPRTKAILVAHLFGDQMDLGPVARFARERGLLVVEDCAQSFTGREYRGHASSDVSMFSFGPIKTATALGGGLLRIQDQRLRERMREIQSRYPIQSRFRFLRRLVRFTVLQLMAHRLPFTVFCETCRLIGKDHDEVLSRGLRGFPGPHLLESLRHRPSGPLLSLLRRRIERFDEGKVGRRVEAAETLIGLIASLSRPGSRAARHTYWAMPVLSAEPDQLVRRLRGRGFDATRGAWSLFTVPAPPTRPDATAPEAEGAMRRIVYLPTWPALRSRDIPRLAQALLESDVPSGPGSATTSSSSSRGRWRLAGRSVPPRES